MKHPLEDYREMAHLNVRLLGPFQATRKEQDVIDFETAKARALLAYLAVEADRPHQREALAEMLWPGRPEGAARANLRHTLAGLRHAIGDRARSGDRAYSGDDDAAPPYLLITRQTIQFNSGSDAWIDVAEFESLAARGMATGRPNVGQLKEAVGLYRGAFLESVSIKDSAGFEEWALLKREQLSRQALGILDRLAEWYRQLGDHERALAYARQRVELEPWDEKGQRQVMRLLAYSDQRGTALAQYEACRHVLEEEMGVEPEEETIVLYERIRDGAELPASAPLTLHNLPAPVTPFVGREAELMEIGKLLQDPTCRHLSLVGPGGSGKTRLALEAAADILSDTQLGSYEHGVYFVSLAPLRSVDGIVSAVAQAIGFSFYPGGEPKQQLLDYLRQKRILLVLDNFEHLLFPNCVRDRREEKGGAGLVTDILRTAPAVKILTTSRTRLNLQSEHLFPVGGMNLPPLLSHEDEEQYSAVELFLTSARRVAPDFEMTADNAADVVRICRLVRGMPLGILLAAAWTRMLTLSEITDQIGRSIDFLTTEGRDVPARQQSMRAVFDHSWSLLTEREREVFCALSIFRGGFVWQAAQEITGASLQELRALVDKSLLHRNPAGRYEIHELLRQYTKEQLDQSPDGGEQARDLHCAYYTAALQQWEANLKSSEQRTALAEMEVEIENARAAWDWAVEHAQVARLDQALDGLCLFYDRHGRYPEGEAMCRVASERLAEASDIGSSRVRARTLAWQGLFAWGARQPEFAARLMQQGLDLLAKPEFADQDTRRERAFILNAMARLIRGTSIEEGRRLCEQSLALYRAVNDQWAVASTLGVLGRLAHDSGSYDNARQYLVENLAIQRALGDQIDVAASLSQLSTIAWVQGHLEESKRLAREAIAICRETGDLTGTADGLLRLGKSLIALGGFAEGCSLLEKSAALFDESGRLIDVAGATLTKSEAQVHLGQYEQVRVPLQTGLTLMRRMGYRWGIGFAYLVMGLVALAEEAYAEAQKKLPNSIVIFREIGHRENLGWALAVSGYAARGLGQPSQAQQYLAEALRIATETGAFVPLMLALPAVALLITDRGEKERAMEIYALASCYPFVANSRWFEDVAGRHIAASLPSEVMTAAQERGRVHDLEATVAELLAELEM